MGGRLIWIAHQEPQGWACSQCTWMCPKPSLLSDAEGRGAYDRLASAKFAEHDCIRYAPRATQPEQDSFSQKARNLVMRGFSPKDAVDLTLRELMLEHRENPKLIEQARVDAEDFLRRVKEGLI
jgi:hypothetical protein